MKRGFSLVEMMVVMGIIAVLSALGITAFINLQKQTQLDKITEEILTSLRTVQNNSIAVKQDSASPPNATKVWAVEVRSAIAPVSSNRLNTLSLYPQGNGNLIPKVEETITLPSAVKISIIDGNGSPRNGTIVAYAVPFGSANILVNDYCLNGSVKCLWKESSKPTREWYVTYTDLAEKNNVYNATNLQDKSIIIKIESTNNNYSKNIIVKASGDAYIE